MSKSRTDRESQMAGAFARAIAMAVAVWLCPHCAGAETFRWTDSQGVTHYTDNLPPEEAVRPHAKLNAEAKIKELHDGQKTKEQLEQFRRLKQLRTEQQRILAEQKDSDQSLVRTYHSADEIQATQKVKLEAVDSAKKISESNRQHQEETLKNLVKRAADIEQSGETVPASLRDSIESTRKMIAIYQEKNRSLENTKSEIASYFAKELKRFNALAALRENPDGGLTNWRSQSQSADVGIVSAITCAEAQCDAAWSLARDYLLAKTTRPMVTETESILQTAAPRDEGDLALLVVRIRDKRNQSILFLDTSCHFSSLGDELCAGDEAKDIRQGFVPFVEKGLNSTRR